MFKPFEGNAKPSYFDVLDTEAQIASLSFFSIKAADLTDKKSKDLYEQLNPSYDIDDKYKRVSGQNA